MEKEIVSTDQAPGAIGPYSQAAKGAGVVCVSGQLPLDPVTGVCLLYTSGLCLRQRHLQGAYGRGDHEEQTCNGSGGDPVQGAGGSVPGTAESEGGSRDDQQWTEDGTAYVLSLIHI